jgi:hypothetical protein
MLGNVSLLLKLLEVEDFRLTEFGKKIVQIYDCLRSFPDQVTMQRSDTGLL